MRRNRIKSPHWLPRRESDSDSASAKVPNSNLHVSTVHVGNNLASVCVNLPPPPTHTHRAVNASTRHSSGQAVYIDTAASQR